MDMFRLRLSESVLTVNKIWSTCLNEQQVAFQKPLMTRTPVHIVGGCSRELPLLDKNS